MLDTSRFVAQLVDRKYSHLCIVPCSFAKYLVNALINDKQGIEYVPCASEAVACSVAAGLKMSGQQPIVIVQSSGLTNMGSCITSLLKPYEVFFPILVSWRTYKPGDAEIQHQHLATRLPELIATYGYSHDILDTQNLDKAIEQIDLCNTQSRMCLLEQSTFSKIDLLDENMLNLSQYPKRSEYLAILNNLYSKGDALFIGTTGHTSREMYKYMPDTTNLYMVGNMGGALSLALGVALSGRQVMVCGGDAEFVMHMGGLTTAGRYAHKIDLTYMVFDNESNKSTGGQNSYQKHISYSGIAKYCNIQAAYSTITELAEFELSILDNKDKQGIRIITLKCDYDGATPRVPLKAIKTRLLPHHI